MNTIARIDTVMLPLPADVDVSDMDYMQLFDRRLFKSRAWRRAKHWRGDGPGLGFVLVNLWVGAFRERPAGSIENDEGALADAAQCDIVVWLRVREEALTGWQLIDGRWHHPVVSEIAWDLWQTRLGKRYEKALESHRAAAKRAMDKGREPPDPPGLFADWLAGNYAATHIYMCTGAQRTADNGSAYGGQSEMSGVHPPDSGGLSPEHPPDDDGLSGVRPEENAKNPSDNGPKRSEAKVLPPVVPLAATAHADGPDWLGKGPEARKRWFSAELGRLRREFGHFARFAEMYVQRRNMPAPVAFVREFKGCWIDGKAIVVPSKKRADAMAARNALWIEHHGLGLTFRHATVDELRAFKLKHPPA